MSANAKKSRKPKTLVDFENDSPEVWHAYESLRDASDQAGGLDMKTRELVRIGIETTRGRKGGLIAHIHRARKAGATRDEIYQTILLAISLVGLPPVLDAYLIAKKALSDKR